jgi:protein-disulfide isomerase
MAAAEAAECVAGEAAAQGGFEVGEVAFWTFHDALFVNQARWAAESDPVNMFVTIASEAGVPTEGLGLCVRSGKYTDLVEASYQNAVQDLRLTGTPSVFLGGLKVGDYANLDEYLRLMRLSDALAAQ